MALVNENFLELPQENVFASIRGEVEKFKVIRPSSLSRLIVLLMSFISVRPTIPQAWLSVNQA